MNDEILVILPCPFCGKTPNTEDCDFVYPVNRKGTLHRAGCIELAGGCGAEVLGSSKKDAICKWNTRAEQAFAQHKGHSKDLYNETYKGINFSLSHTRFWIFNDQVPPLPNCRVGKWANYFFKHEVDQLLDKSTSIKKGAELMRNAIDRRHRNITVC